MPIDEHREANRLNWDERVPIHLASKTYDVAGFLSDSAEISAVVRFDKEHLGDVRGKSLLHLQCHFGRDTLSWARLGANVTGVDFSAPALEAARRLSEESGVPGRFILSELYDAPSVIGEQFDIVYTGVGALCWLPDIRGWAEVVGKLLKPGGVFYIREGHPVLWCLDDETEDATLSMRYPYFETADPTEFDEGSTYTDGQASLQHSRTYVWNHGIGEIITALIDVGLELEYLHEHRFCYWQALPWMIKGEDGLWRLPDHRERAPLMYSIRAVKRA